MLVVRDPIARGSLSGEYGSAEQRAAVLLLAHLTPRQRKSYLRSGGFVVKGSKGRRFRLVNYGKAAQWLPLWPLPIYVSGCIHSYGLNALGYCNMPLSDRLLSLKLLAETDQ